MNKYESVIIINPNCTEEAVKALESKFTGLINQNGKVESVENMGKKKLAGFNSRARKKLQNYRWNTKIYSSKKRKIKSIGPF